MIITIEGHTILLHQYPEIAVMIMALLDQRDAIHNQGFGEVSLDYLGAEVVLTLSRRTQRVKARKIVDKSVFSAQ